MKRQFLLLIAVVFLVGVVIPAHADRHPGIPVNLVNLPLDAGFASPNVDYVGTIPLDNPGVSATFRVDDHGRHLMYVSGVPGLSIYDISDPVVPLLLGHLPLPNWENEDLAVSADGRTALMTEFTGLGYLHVFDVSDPTLPLLADSALLSAAGHIAECMDPACDVIWGSDGEIWDARNKRNVLRLSQTWTSALGLPRGHNINIDDAGYAITDTTPMGVVDVPNMSLVDLRNPRREHKLAQSRRSDHTDRDTAYQHNNKRPRADEYGPNASSTFRPGDLVLGNGETNFTGVPLYHSTYGAGRGSFCADDSGPFAVWDARNVLSGQEMRVADVFRPVSGEYYDDGDPAVNGMGCSGHWFTVSEGAYDAAAGRFDPDDYAVAAAWYEHGTRILHVDGQTGAISNLGWWQPGVGSASAAYWVGDGYVYTVDYGRGIDILRFDHDPGLRPTVREFDASWLQNVGAVNPLAAQERAYCALFAG